MKKAITNNRKFVDFLCKRIENVKFILIWSMVLVSIPIWADTPTISITQKLDHRNSTMVDVFKLIEEETGYVFFYPEEIQSELNKKVTPVKTTGSIEEILNPLFEKSSLTYQINGTQVVVKRKSIVTSAASSMQQQKRKITGSVVDASKEPLIGVSIAVKGTTQGTVTDVDGNFAIDNLSDDAVLVISYVGYVTQEVALKNQKHIAVTLKEDTQVLDDVVIIGYGSSSTRKVNNAVTKVATETIKNMSVSNMASALSGLGRGLIVKQSGGGPGWDIPTISIRGGGEPLYVIDGIISTKNDFARLSSNDVEDITLLKDAGATAVYGSRAADGVVLVTTKNPRESKISYSNNFSWATPTVNPDRMDSYEYVTFCNRIADATGVARPYSDEVVAKYLSGTDPNYTSTIYWDEVFKNYAPSQRHNLTLQGVEKTIKYVLSLNYQTNKSKYKVSDAHYQDVYSVLGKIGKQYEEIGVKIDAKLAGTIRDYKSTSFDYWTIFGHTGKKLPILNPFNSKGHYKQIDGIYNPFYLTDPANGYQRIKDNVFTGTFTATWDLPWVKGLQIGFTGNYDINFTHNKNFKSLQPFYDDNDQPIYQEKPSLSESKNNYNTWTIQAYANYKKKIDEHSLEASLYYEAYEYKSWYLSASRKDYTSDVIDQLFFGPQAGLTNSGSADESARLGYIGRLSYDYNDKYMISGSFRYDASERFRPEDRWGFFPSVSLGWRISKEPFAESLFEKLKISNLKLRFSYGQTGNDSISRFAYLSTYSVTDKRYYMGNEWVSGIYSNGLPAGDISWYKQVSYNAGIDLDLFDSRLKLAGDGFYYRTTGFLGSPQVDYTVPLGFSLPQINSGAKRRGGYELSADWKDKIGNDFEYTIGANFTHFGETWENNPSESETTTMNPYLRTNHTDAYYFTHGYKSNGYYSSMDDVLGSPRLNGEVEMLPGDLKYIDANGDGKIDSDDYRKIGKWTFPTSYLGFNLGLSYKGFYMSALFQGAFNFSMMSYENFRFERGAAGQTINKFTDVWTPENTDARFPRTNLNSGRSINNQTTDFWLLRGDYVRLKNLEIGYDLKRSVLKNVRFIKGFNVFFNSTNLFTIAPDLMGLVDPESTNFSTDSYPVDKTYSFGVNIDF